ncbi:MAG: winged helix-turn-helix transcriptional regulator [Proteobacteria bacterium]|nr:winged helix-turn-helix transcriptional regulator [Pseudomonadota bacterium]MCP4918443.1 winged helix-turn-helix transcriptional regulator [Pseudomonadota bacterium]
MDYILQALADPRRRMIVEILRTGEQPVGALVARLPIAQSGVSRHLRILREAGLVRVRREGQRRVYALQPEALRELTTWLLADRAVWDVRLDDLDAELARRLNTREGADE